MPTKLVLFQILYFVGGVRIINRNNVFHSFPDREITCPPCSFVEKNNMTVVKKNNKNISMMIVKKTTIWR
jgi:hypothetical protein